MRMTAISRPQLLLVAALPLVALLGAPSASWADNPIIQTNFTADPAPMVHEGVLYLYTTHDEDQTVDDFFTMNDWRAYSSTDAVNWTDHGSVLRYNDFNWATGDAWAGQVIHRDSKFYFYVPMRIGGGSHLGVAVADSPIGPFENALPMQQDPFISSDCGDIDPTVFIDDDGQAYLYWGNPDLCYVKLNEDMISYSGGVQHVPMTTQSWGVRSDSERPTSYEEGPWLYKRDGLYYMIFAAGPISEHIAWSTSSGAEGPWTYGGVFIAAGFSNAAFTIHPGVVDYKGSSLIFYHNQALSRDGFKRSVCVDEFTYGADGAIPQVTPTNDGAPAVDVLNPFAQVEAETIAWEEGVETEPCNEGGMNVTDISNGDYIKLEEVEFGAGATSFEYRVASGSGGGAIELHLDSENGPLAGTCSVDSTGGEQTWATQTCTVSDATGKHDLFLRFTGGGFKFNWWRFDGPGDPGTGGTGGMGGEGGVGGGGFTPTGGVQSTGGGGGIITGGTSPTGGIPATGGTPSGGAQTGGAPSTGGEATGGAGTSGGSPTTGGTTAGGTGGNVATGGTPMGTGGSGAPAGGSLTGGTSTGGEPSPAGANGSSEDGGCGCGVVGARSKWSSLGVLALLGLLVSRLSRRRRVVPSALA